MKAQANNKKTITKSKDKKANRIVVNRKSLKVEHSTYPPKNVEEADIHQDTQPENIELVDTFKKANELSDCDKLEFELGRLRSYLVSWITYMEFDGKLYKLMVDPMGKNIKVLEK